MAKAFTSRDTQTFRSEVTFVQGFGVVADEPWHVGSGSTNTATTSDSQLVAWNGIYLPDSSYGITLGGDREIVGLFKKTNGALLGGDLTGNSRGVNSIDIQPYRDNTYQVASGAGSISIGNENVANGANSICLGTNCYSYVTNDNGISIGNAATCNESSLNAISIGTSALNNYGTNSIAIGISSQNVLSYNSVAVGRLASTESAGSIALGYSASVGYGSEFSVSIGKSASISYDSSASVAIGFNSSIGYSTFQAIVLGADAALSGSNSYAVAIGSNSILEADAKGIVFNNGIGKNANTKGQIRAVQWSGRTTNNTVTTIYWNSDDSAGNIVVPNNRSWFANIKVHGTKNDFSETVAREYTLIIRKGANHASLAIDKQLLTFDSISEDSDLDIIVDADTSNGTLRIRVQGRTGETWLWKAVADISEVWGT